MSSIIQPPKASGPNRPPTYPIVFLDIDGVLNSNEYFATTFSRTEWLVEKDKWGPAAHYDPAMIKLLNQVLDEAGAKVVYHTNWRYMFSKKDLDTLLRSRGWTGESVGVVPSIGNRESNITAWLNRYCQAEDQGWRTKELPANSPPFVAFDDMDHEFPLKLNGRFIWTADGFEGLTPELVTKAVELLKKPLTRDDLELKVSESEDDKHKGWE